jgi:predicted metalloprotease
MQEDLAKLFDDRFGELNVKIETLRSKIGLQPEEIPITVLPQIQEDEKTTPTTEKTRKRKPRKTPQKPRKTAAEERIEKIRAEVERVLDRLEQMEIET